MTGGTLLVVPMKDPARAKTRLRGAMGPAETARFALRLFDRTLALLAGMRAHGRLPDTTLAVVTGHDGIASRATEAGLQTIQERPGADLPQAVADAAGFAVGTGHARLCVLPADLAAPDAADIAQLLAQDFGGPGVALVPSRDWGTNALLAAPPDAIAFAYGVRSFHAHCAAATAAGLTPRVLPLESLRWDIDRSEDLAEFFGMEGQG
ncbi:MAG: 2-phospho-L-lactate guanylyltransferase [Pseudomonadota bacterium]